MKTSAIEGVKTGAGVFCTSILAGQLVKIGAINVFKPSSERLMKALGEDFATKLLKAFSQEVLAENAESVAETATKQAAKLLRAEGLFAFITTIVFSVPDVIDMFEGRISKKQFVKNFAVAAIGTVAGTIGYGIGGMIGNLIVPGVGTIPAGVVGSILFGIGGGMAADFVADYITSDDAEEMYVIIEQQFMQLCEDYLVNEDEVQNILTEFSNMLNEDMYKDMYQNENRELFITSKLEPLFELEVTKREKIEAPTEEDMRFALKEELQGVVFIH